MKNDRLYIIIAEPLPQRRPQEGVKKGDETDCIVNKQCPVISVKLLSHWVYWFLSQKIGLINLFCRYVVMIRNEREGQEGEKII